MRPELALGLLDAQIRAQAQSLTTLKAAVTRADAWRGDRGEADETAAQILTLLD